ncbi:MAG TPA: 2,3,4,5-tetrahydropyridine-2,6-dicarboxylate N-succinyltransferase [Mycobacteriales bacterium]|jgi:2,3,4,5-tetrahydropyridine-2-carboxylate N-succinyltransferase|nr:2,3,4,5-tetrahydropyridine-2,6-dicarboxylate N-succinyltransferase [Mycobacteriales bacterium]
MATGGASYRDEPAAGIGVASYDSKRRLLDAWFPEPVVGSSSAVEPIQLPPTGTDAVREVFTETVRVSISSLADPPADTADVWLRLHLLSHRLIKPHEANLDGVFGLLTNVAWTSLGPVAAEDVEATRLRARMTGIRLEVYGVDKFPRMTDYVVPSGVRIADADRVRLGAHLASGTTVMHEGFVNYNAGTLGASMVEGRISAGVVVGNGTDVGGGAAVMGTLSGGGQIVISLGERCLLGSNSGIGIPLGDDCVVEAGCYVTAGSKVTLPDGSVVAARELSGVSNMMFWRNSISGALEARPRTGKWTGLNEALHAN